MKTASILGLVLGAGLAHASCANNCARGIAGTRSKSPDLAVRQTDCINFMTTTVYATPTATTTPAPVYQRKRRDQLAKRGPVTVTGSFPAYATECDNAVAYSSACSCWGYTAAVVTKSTPTTTVVAPVPTCHKGLQRATFTFQAGPFAPGVIPANSVAYYKDNFDTIAFHGQTPASTDVTGAIDGVSGCGREFRGIEWRGYFTPKVTGTYTFAVTSADEVGLVWLGPAAVSGFAVGNSLVASGWNSPPASVPFAATAGSITPFRVVFANAQGCEALAVTVTDPSGNVVLDGSTSPNNSFVQYCDGAPGAADWPAWSSE